MNKIDIDLCSYEELVAARPDLVESIARKSRVENIDEAARKKAKALRTTVCPTCNGDGVVDSRESAVPRKKTTTIKASEVSAPDIPAAQQSLVSMYEALGLSEAEAKIAAGIEEQFVGDVPVSELLKPY